MKSSNRYEKYLGCSILPVYFEPTFTLNGIPISESDVRPPFAVEGRKLRAVAHLALLGVKRQDPTFRIFIFLICFALRMSPRLYFDDIFFGGADR